MDRLLAGARLAARAGAWFGGALVSIAAVVISIDVLERKLFDLTLGGASEISGYVLAIATTWALALALIDRAHVRIDSFYVLLPTRVRAVLDVVSLVAFMAFGALVTVKGWSVFARSYGLNAHSLTPLAVPLAIPQFLWVAGFAFFLAVMALLLLRALWALSCGRIAEVQQLLGSRSALQEVEEAIEEHERHKES